MAHDLMYRCEQKKRFLEDGTKVWRWVERDVSGLESGRRDDVRCLHCHGAVRVHVKQVENGPADHVEHIRRVDSEGCRAGSYVKGAHVPSQLPVE